MLSDINNLYQELIIDHNSRPRNFGVIKNVSHKACGFNPFCGDKIYIYLKIKNKYIEDISFTGEGCSICKASASIMTDKVKGLSIDESKKVFKVLRLLITKNKITDINKKELGKLLVFGSIVDFPMRIKCVTLAWHAMRSAIKNTK